MTAFGKANYDAYREFSHGTSMISGDPIPEWDKLPVHIQSAWDAAADGVALVLAECPVDEDMPGNEPAKTVIVTTDTGAEIRFTADEFDGDGQLDIRDTSRAGNTGIIGSYAPGSWRSARFDGATGPDGAGRQLAIAKAALQAIACNAPGNPGEIANRALDSIWSAET